MPANPTADEVKFYLNECIDTFKKRPPTNSFEHGYEAALKAIYGDLFLSRAKRAENAEEI